MIALLILLFCGLVIIIFLAKELLLKFSFAHQFLSVSDQVTSYQYPGATRSSHGPGMRNILITSDQPFSILVGFEFHIALFGYTGYDHYGFVQSDENNVVAIRTYLGRKPVKFMFLVNKGSNQQPFTVSSTEEDQKYPVPRSNIFTPHFWQRLGIYG